jgi:hypothetical protein
MSEAQRNRPYLQHGSRHLSTGTDPIPTIPLVAPLVPVAHYAASAALPISSFGSASVSISLDTFTASSEADGTTYFDLSGGTARLQAGFYYAVGFVQFNTVADWSAKTSYLALGFITNSGNYQMGATFFQSTSSANNKASYLSVVDMLNIQAADTVALTIGTSAVSISPLPSNLVVAKAAFCRLNDAI